MKEAFASSFYSEYDGHREYHENNAIDGKRYTTFASKGELNPWLQVEFKEIAVVTRVTIFNRFDCCWERTKNLQVRVGYTKFIKGVNTLHLTANVLCATYQGPGTRGEEIALDCKRPITGQYVSVQLMQESTAALNFGEIQISGSPGT